MRVRWMPDEILAQRRAHSRNHISRLRGFAAPWCWERSVLLVIERKGVLGAAKRVLVVRNHLCLLLKAKLVSIHSTALSVVHLGLVFAGVVFLAMDACPVQRVDAIELGVVVLHVVVGRPAVSGSGDGAATIAKSALETVTVWLYTFQTCNVWS